MDTFHIGRIQTETRKKDDLSPEFVNKWPTSLIAHRTHFYLTHHHWLDSPWWALAFLRSFTHSSLLRATFLHFLTPNILISWSTPSSHCNFGLPTLLTPSGLVLHIFLIVLSLFTCTKCPAHANLLTLMKVKMSSDDSTSLWSGWQSGSDGCWTNVGEGGWRRNIPVWYKMAEGNFCLSEQTKCEDNWHGPSSQVVQHEPQPDSRWRQHVPPGMLKQIFTMCAKTTKRTTII